ncbi:arginyl-tRNA--protein transferase 1 [Planococcus citri]|uniref:arginyl-tRNA--protein transferase 1 n=1 Tax=Planococcus citri TaxID=170843 RepID=UPI0031F99389
MSHIYSIVEYYGFQTTNSCGYCKTPRGHSDCGMWLHYLTPNDYQNLIDRGWRRSGCYGYKPMLETACCQMYTIRCAAYSVQLKKSQKKLIKRINRFITSGDRKKWHSKDSQAAVSEGMDSHEPRSPENNVQCISNSSPSQDVPVPTETKIIVDTPKAESASLSENVTDPAPNPNLSAKNSNKRKTFRIERAIQRVMNKGGVSREEAIKTFKTKVKQPKLKSLEEFLSECDKPNSAHKLELKIVQSSPSNETFEKTFEAEYEVYRKYQVTIHKDKLESCSPNQFRRFLVKSPLEPVPIEGDNPPVPNYGSYHQQYWLDGKLIAVGVIDILPRCVSSVYFFYDPEYNDLVLGTYGSMRELELVRKLQNCVPSLQFYYMGFYIHTCPKMRYKARVSPSFLLCPEVYSWHPISQCLQKLDEYGYSRLNEDPNAKDANLSTAIQSVLVLYREKIMRYGDFLRKGGSGDDHEIKEYLKAVGKECANSMILYRR